jgi:A118 family predicted phage portal protein
VVEEGSAAKDRVDEVLNDGAFHARLLEAAEFSAALGGAWLRLVWDQEIADHVMIDAVAADAAIGEWMWGKLTAVTFFTEYTEGSGNQEVIRHLERYEPGVVYHGLYKGDAKSLGIAVPLADHPSTAPYVELVDDAGAIPTGVKTILAAYVANMRPQRRWRKVEALTQLGRSDYDGVEQLMDALDETYTSWMRDVRLGKARIIVPENMLKDLSKGKGAAWDEDQEVFTALKESLSDDTITPQQFAIRVEEHARTAEALVDQILDAAGYSPSTFGRGGEGVATATEVVSRERKSDRTRSKKTRYWSQALSPLLTTWLELDGLVFGGGAKGEVQVVWPDDSQPDPEVLSRTIETLHRAVAVSADTKVRMLHPDWDEEQIAAEVAAVIAESGALVPELPPYPEEEPVTD